MLGVHTNRDLPHGRVSLKGNLDQLTVMQAWPTQQKDLANIQGKLTLDLKGIEHTDSAGLAWLLALKKQCHSHSIELCFENMPAAIVRLSKISDVDGLLSLQ